MPIYGYACKACGHTLDALQKIADDPLVECPACGALELKRQLSAPRFRLKGKGWYETDFKSDNQRNLASDKDSSGGTSASSKSEKTADKKSDAAAKSKPAGSGGSSSGSKESAA